MTPRYKHVLLIDDNEIDVLVNRKILENEMFAGEISSHSSATDALKMLQNSNGNLPDLIFLDIMMPVMDGFAFLDEFAKLPDAVTKQCKIVMLSTSESFKD